MKYHKLHPFLPVLLTVIFFLLFSPPAGANEWSMTFRTRIPEPAADKGFLSFDLKAGMGPFTTDGYDSAVDVMALPAGPLQAVFSHEGDPAYPPHLRELWTDIRGESFPQSWTIRIRSLQSAYPVTFEWSPSPVFEFDLCRNQSLELMDESTGLPFDLSGEPFFSYSSSGSLSSPDVRDFILTVNSTPQNSPSPPTGLRAKRKGQQIQLSWDRVNDLSVSGVQILRRAEGDSEWVLLGEVRPKDRDYKDGDLQAGVTYFYSLTTVGPNGCHSLLSKEVRVDPRHSN